MTWILSSIYTLSMEIISDNNWITGQDDPKLNDIRCPFSFYYTTWSILFPDQYALIHMDTVRQVFPTEELAIEKGNWDFGRGEFYVQKLNVYQSRSY